MKRILFFAFAFLLVACADEELPALYTPPTPVIDHAPTVFEIDIESPASQERLSDSHPNIILVVTDDQPYHTVHYMPFELFCRRIDYCFAHLHAQRIISRQT